MTEEEGGEGEEEEIEENETDKIRWEESWRSGRERRIKGGGEAA